ncbi:tellurite resistance TerB family protein [Polyangium jinanense]|uniref:TerB family tellurite resistance protein n=1 Tax=Polyangium jinanense TaxID=2829994 RepID=A0A9X4ARF8_9BACT|nr:TerB family tellurite resistance protein [Polyangium jinanense]MDC3952479.1 TerB family tellurite resistance protein [Polyangium jinanense]MDC3980107.1 TerB family tellurite resistance protein [Polyangium jinanense]
MGLLAWLGLKRGDTYPNVDALLAELRRALPDDEAVVLRYIAAVVVLLGKVAGVDGRLTEGEEQTLRSLLAHIEGLSPEAIEAVTHALKGKLPELREEELTLCVRELKSLCDGRERVEVIRLLAKVAVADGRLSDVERAELHHVAADLGVPESELAAVEEEVA